MRRYPKPQALGYQLAVYLALFGCNDAEPRSSRSPSDGSLEPDAVTPAEDGSDAAAPEPDAQLAACSEDPGLDPARGCGECLPGYRSESAGDDDFENAGSGPLRCTKLASCSELSCGSHGRCESGESGAYCACESGFAGERCELCAPPFEAAPGGACVLARQCAKQRCGGHGSCALDTAGAPVCICDTGWDISDSCGGDSIALGAPEEPIAGSSRAPLRVELRNGAHCTGQFQWTIVEGGGQINPDTADSKSAMFSAPPPGEQLGRAVVRAVCSNDATLTIERSLPLARASNPSSTEPPTRAIGPCPAKLATEIDPVVIDWMNANDIPGGTIGVSIYGGPVCLRAYGYASTGSSADGRRGIEPMRTCTPMRLASVTKTFTRSALRAQLYGSALPANMGGGTLSGSTPILPMVDSTLGLGNNNQPAWNEPATLYSPGWPSVPSHCTPASPAIDAAWTVATVDGTLNHRAGFQPNSSYRASSSSKCNSAPGEVCKDFNNIADPTVSSSISRRVANDLGIATHGVPQIDDLMAWMGGVCMYGIETSNNSRYSNFGYSVAGRAVELLSGQSYESFVQAYLEKDGLIDRSFKAYGKPIVYQGQNLANGPRGFALPKYMQEARYYSKLGVSTDVTRAVQQAGSWTFPEMVEAPYGASNYDLMYAHGGLVANTLALLNYARVYAPRNGTRRAKPFLTVHDDTTRGGQSGLLWGTFTDLHEFDDSDDEFKNAQGPGCYVSSGTINDLSQLKTERCPLPHGITMALLFNGDPKAPSSAGYVAGRHDRNVLKQGLRRAFSRFASTTDPWLLSLLKPEQLSEGCEDKCPAGAPFCTRIDCGDGDLDPGEQCDDGNNLNFDTCQGNCTLPPSLAGAPQTPPSYARCNGVLPGDCLGGPCAARKETFVKDTDRLDPNSEAHPDGDFSAHSQCRDNFTGGGDADEAVCHREVFGGKAFGVCRECGVDTFVGCLCPAPNAEDGGCNGLSEQGLDCVAGRCVKGTPPSWMCKADCQNIYSKSGYCNHDSAKGAVCYDQLCSEEVDEWCDIVQGNVCNSQPNSCSNGSCCEPECMNDTQCEQRGYTGFHCNQKQRCVP